MNYDLAKEVLELVSQFETANIHGTFNSDIEGFKRWIAQENTEKLNDRNVTWENKNQGRSSESVISTMLVHLNKYAKNYSKAVLHGSPFATQDEFIYLINLNAFGELGKMELIKMNIQDKPTGMQIVNRLIKQGWVSQTDSVKDKRSKRLNITAEGTAVLNMHMSKIRQATKIVSGNLTDEEKLQLIKLLSKLTDFHQAIYENTSMETDNVLNDLIAKYIIRPN